MTQITAECFISSPLIIVGLALNDGLPHFRQFDFQMAVAVDNAAPSALGSVYCISNANPTRPSSEAAPEDTSHGRLDGAVPFCINETLTALIIASSPHIQPAY
jgi:hypothetical protein